MIPQLVTIGYRQAADRRLWRLYVPVVPAALLLSPLLLLAAAGGLVACRIYRVRPVGAVRGGWRVLRALPGTRFELDDGQLAVLLIVR